MIGSLLSQESLIYYEIMKEEIGIWILPGTSDKYHFFMYDKTTAICGESFSGCGICDKQTDPPSHPHQQNCCKNCLLEMAKWIRLGSRHTRQMTDYLNQDGDFEKEV